MTTAKRQSVHLGAWSAAVLAGALAGFPALSQAKCAASSGTKTAALIELYTSEGCSSCPPADKQLGRLSSVLDADAVVVPLAWHVTYWDYIGWKDPFAQATFDKRHQWLVGANGRSAVYTPHFFAGGMESPNWASTLRADVRRINSKLALTKVSVQGQLLRPGVLNLTAQASAQAETPNAALYLALTESKLSSSVARGENAGVVLGHDHVVRVLLGPFALRDGKVSAQQAFALDPRWASTNLTAVAFVQDLASGQVTQAVSAPSCALP